MKNVALGFVSFMVGAGIILGYSGVKKQNSSPPIPSPSQKQKSATPSFSIETPPSESIQGTISSRSGILSWESRVATMPSELTDSVPLQQGERLLTGDNSAATLQFDHVGSIQLSQNADLSFIQTLPVDFVVEQKKGSVKYIITGTTPLSIRVRNALVTKTDGEIEITIQEGDPIVLISTTQGTAQIGFNDLDFVSQVFTLREKQTYEYNSDERTAVNSMNK